MLKLINVEFNRTLIKNFVSGNSKLPFLFTTHTNTRRVFTICRKKRDKNKKGREKEKRATWALVINYERISDRRPPELFTAPDKRVFH